MLYTHPDFRRRGAGTMLCNWGQKVAMKKGLDLTVQATPMGRLLYEHIGYRFLGSVKVQTEGEDESFDIDSLAKKMST